MIEALTAIEANIINSILAGNDIKSIVWLSDYAIKGLTLRINHIILAQ